MSGQTVTPTVTNEIVYAGSGRTLLAFPASCGAEARRCLPVWSARTSEAVSGVPTVARGLVLVTTYGGARAHLYAFPVRCPAMPKPCRPRWVAVFKNSLVSGPALAGGLVFVTHLSNSSYINNEVQAYRLDCGRGGAVCRPQWVTTTGGSFGGSTSPRLDADMVFVGSGGRVYAFPLRCELIEGRCPPTWSVRFGGTGTIPSVVASDGLVYVSAGGELHVFEASCEGRHGRCEPLWISNVGDDRLRGYPLIGQGMVYATSRENRIYAFPVTCGENGASCRPAWHASPSTLGRVTGLSEGLGLVYAVSRDGVAFAYPASCEVSPCEPVWSVDVPGIVNDRLLVSQDDGMVYLTSWQGRVYAFAQASSQPT